MRSFAACVDRRGSSNRGSCGLDRFLERWLEPSEFSPHTKALQKEDDVTSAETLSKHYAAAGPQPNIMAYVCSDAPGSVANGSKGTGASSSSGLLERKRRAQHIPPNTPEAVPFETDCFVGEVLLVCRENRDSLATPMDSPKASPHRKHFEKRKRNWEFRVQGRFKVVPKGEMFVGIVLRDFNYNQAVAQHSRLVQKAGMSLVHYDMYMSWGDRCKEALKPNAEMSHLVTGISAWDQIVITPAGRRPPSLKGGLQNLGKEFGRNLVRAEMGLNDYSREAKEVFRSISTKDTYTMCFWGVSQVIDLSRWTFEFKIGSVAMARFFEEWPIHCVMYEVQPQDLETNKRHLETLKLYYLDVMFWSTTVRCPQLPSRYVFLDAPAALEKAAAQTSGGVFATGDAGDVSDAGSAGTASLTREPSRPSFWSAWASKLRWIPVTTCGKNHGEK
mmetsp:Transcript_56862/g.122987  ORF Transcript_56862/g.122987 Transcript_56862/m.122987 type:complete len:445 (-) Transcript_56862:77-1411(-)